MGKRPKKYFLYHRVSKKIQADDGEGIIRQQETTKEWIESHNKKLIKKGESPYVLGRIYEDKGRSGFTGENIDKGELGQLLKDAQNGHIRNGDIVVIELPDRFSRAKPREVRKKLDNLLDAGIKIAFTKWNHVFEDNMAHISDVAASMMLDIALFLSHQESKQKSERIKESNKISEEKGLKSVAKTPIWLRRTLDRKEYREVDENVKIIKEIYRLRMEGLGPMRIVSSLGSVELNRYTYNENDELIVSSKNKPLCESSVRLFLSDESVFGKKGDVEGYYPVIIDERIFNAVNPVKEDQKEQENHRGKGGRANPEVNALSGVVYCDKCGYSMSYHSAKSVRGKLRAYLYCNGKRKRKQCDAKNIKYSPEFEEQIYQMLSKLDYRESEAIDIADLKVRLSKQKTITASARKLLKNYPDDIGWELEYKESWNEEQKLEVELIEAKNSRSGDLSNLNIDIHEAKGRRKFNNILKEYNAKVFLLGNKIKIVIGAWDGFEVKGSLSSNIYASRVKTGKNAGAEGIDFDARERGNIEFQEPEPFATKEEQQAALFQRTTKHFIENMSDDYKDFIKRESEKNADSDAE